VVAQWDADATTNQRTRGEHQEAGATRGKGAGRLEVAARWEAAAGQEATAPQEAEAQKRGRQHNKAMVEWKISPNNINCTKQYVEICWRTFGAKCWLLPQKFAMNPPKKRPGHSSKLLGRVASTRPIVAFFVAAAVTPFMSQKKPVRFLGSILWQEVKSFLKNAFVTE
jgi:hypothetical protein